MNNNEDPGIEEVVEDEDLELTEGILFSCTNAIETSACFMIYSTALGPGV